MPGPTLNCSVSQQALSVYLPNGSGGTAAIAIPNIGTVQGYSGTTPEQGDWENICLLIAELQAAWGYTAGNLVGVSDSPVTGTGNGTFGLV